ncbi:unnamed protein product, partial [marine sediment metagenome]
MKITERKFIFKTLGNQQWNKTHAQVPFPLQIKDDELRIFYSTRDSQSNSSVTFIDVDIE